eukprot:jgi/Galph1/1016/GphlegSOOS_G5766.1
MSNRTGLTQQLSQTLFSSNSFVDEVANVLKNWETGFVVAREKIAQAAKDQSTALDLQQMELGNESLKDLFPLISQLSNLKHLNLFLNRITELPEEFGTLSSLETLNVACNPLKSIPESFKNLEALKELDLGFTNTLEVLPEVFERMQKLKVGSDYDILERIIKCHVRLRELPKSLCCLQSLEELHLYGNLLTTLPQDIGNLSSLRLLNIGRNNLDSVPSSIGSLSALEILYLYENDLRCLPSSIRYLSKIRALGLDGNRLLCSLPSNIKETDAKAVAAFYAEHAMASNNSSNG